MAFARYCRACVVGSVLAAGWAGPAAGQCFIRGEANCDGLVNIFDAVTVLSHLFAGGGWTQCMGLCMDAADVNDDGAINITDPVYLLNHLFLGGPPIPPPDRLWQVDPTPDGLLCDCGLNSIPELPEFDSTGNYHPYFVTGEMSRPRYFHASISKARFPVVLGGSDERGFSGIDSVEFFGEQGWDKTKPRPESLAGSWFDTNFEGDPITFKNGPRMLFTVDLLPDGRILCAGGTRDLLEGFAVPKAEILDLDLRTLETVEADMVEPRFRHASIALGDGKILFVGGQMPTTATIVRKDCPWCEPAGRVDVFISTNTAEVYSIAEGTFAPLMFPGTERFSKLQTPRGRAGHALAAIAGPDAMLRTADDIFVVAGGFQTLSGEFAPANKLPGAVGRLAAEGVTVIEFLDPATWVFTVSANLGLESPRINDPHIMNLGTHNDFTIDGVKGMGNVILITGGNTDEGCPVTPVTDELFSAIFTGFGPAQGLQFLRISDPEGLSHAQGIEHGSSRAVGRCAANPVAVPRWMKTTSGAGILETWVIAAGGVSISSGVGGCSHAYGDEPTIRAGCAFDPFYSLPALRSGLSARDLPRTRGPENPTGIVGAWLTLDGEIPTVDLTGYGSPEPPFWAKAAGVQRVFHRNIQLPGEDGILDTPDDRVLLAGGGTDYEEYGGEPAAPSAEILLPPGANATEPSP